MIFKPIFAQFELTEGCTHRCVHCYNYYSQNRISSPASTEVAEAISKIDLFHLTLTGGEPLLARRILYYTIRKFKELNTDLSLNSNLYLLERKDADFFKKQGLNSILSSILDSREEVHDELAQKKGSFKKLVNSLDILVNEEINVALNMVVSKRNIHDVYKTGKFLFDRFGIKRFSATPVVPSPQGNYKDLILDREEYISVLGNLLELEKDLGMTTDSLHPVLPCMFDEIERKKYNKFLKKRSCAASKGAITFSPKGDVRVCAHENRIYGNILINPIEDILKNMEEWTNHSLTPIECGDCRDIIRCHGGCRVSAEAMTGKLNGIDPYFYRPIKESFQQPHIQKDIERVKPIKGNIRYRVDNKESVTVYINPTINARLGLLEFEVLKRLIAGQTYQDVSIELEDPQTSKEVFNNLIQKGLLI
jgi:radical SAM protein with 4Fe4S-binding SPASM domain